MERIASSLTENSFGLQRVVADRLGQQMPLGDFHLLVLGVAGDTDDLHAVHQGRRDVQRIGRGHEHDARQVVLDLEIVVHEGRVLLRVEHLEQRRRRIAAEIHAHLVDLVEQEERIGFLGLLHRLDDLAGHRADIGAPVAADLGLVAHAAQRHADELAAGRLGDRLAERGLADAGRADEAEDRPLQLLLAALHGEVFDDAVLDLVEAVVVGVEHLLREVQVLLDLGVLAPRDRQQPVEIVAHHRGFRRHRRHRAQLLQLGLRLLAGLLGELGLLDARLDLGGLVAAVLAFAELLLDRLHLLVEVVLALRLLHLALDARADALLHLQHRDLGLHEAHRLLEPLLDGERAQHLLLLGDLDREMRGDGVGELGIVVDLAGGANHFGRDLLVQLDVVLEVRDHRARQRLDLDLFLFRLGEHDRVGLMEVGARR